MQSDIGKVKRRLSEALATIFLGGNAMLSIIGEEGGSADIGSQGCPGCVGELTGSEDFRIAADGLPVNTFPFFPQAGLLWGDLFISNFTDRIPGEGIGDYEGNRATYDGHGGIDSNILFWDRQDGGFPIFAVLDGTVVGTRDGEFDRNTTWNGQSANFVRIDHGNGLVTRYFHLKKDSVAVVVGEQVSAGQQIGLTGSSGISTTPHLHFQTEIDGRIVEPFAGSARSGSSLWQYQPEYATETYVREFLVATETIANWPGLPEPIPRNGTIVASEEAQTLYFWWYIINRKADSSYKLIIRRPNGSIASTATGSYENASRRFWQWRSRNIVYNQPGTWTATLEMNGVVLLVAPFTVVSQASEVVNRPPFDAAFLFRKPAITEEDVPVCEIAEFLPFDDPDYEIVRYRYVWKVNGAVVREIVSAAKSDALARNLFARGDVIRCEVTPRDSVSEAATSVVETGVTEKFTDWIARHGQIEDPGANPDSDERSNFVEYLLGTSPVRVDEEIINGRGFGIEAFKRLKKTDVSTAAVLFSEDLRSWKAYRADEEIDFLGSENPTKVFYKVDSVAKPDPVVEVDPIHLGIQ